MAKVELTAMHIHMGGPSVPSPINARIVPKEWLGGGTVPAMEIYIGDDTISVWPVDPDYWEEFAKQIPKLMEQVRNWRGRA